MKIPSKYFFEAYIGIVVLYFNTTILLFSNLRFGAKLIFLLITLFIFFILSLFGFAFKTSILKIQSSIKKLFREIKFDKIKIISATPIFSIYAFILLVLTAIIEFVSLIFIDKLSFITFGFPMPFYSFVIDKFLLNGLILDFIFYLLLIFFFGYLLDRE